MVYLMYQLIFISHFLYFFKIWVKEVPPFYSPLQARLAPHGQVPHRRLRVCLGVRWLAGSVIQAGWYVRCCPGACGEAEGAGGWLAGFLGVTWVAQHVAWAKPQLSLPEWTGTAVPALLTCSMPACLLYHLTHIHTFPYWAPSASATMPQRSRLQAHVPLWET